MIILKNKLKPEEVLPKITLKSFWSNCFKFSFVKLSKTFESSGIESKESAKYSKLYLKNLFDCNDSISPERNLWNSVPKYNLIKNDVWETNKTVS